MKELDLVIGSLGGCLRGICSNCEYGDSDCHKDELLRDALAYLRELYYLREDCRCGSCAWWHRNKRGSGGVCDRYAVGKREDGFCDMWAEKGNDNG